MMWLVVVGYGIMGNIIIYGFQVLYCIAGKFSNPCHALKNSAAVKGLKSKVASIIM